MPKRPIRKPAPKRQSPQRDPLLSLRVPPQLYADLKAAAAADHRKLPDWMRLNLPRLLFKPVLANPETFEAALETVRAQHEG